MALPVSAAQVEAFCVTTQQIIAAINSIPQLRAQQLQFVGALTELEGAEALQLEQRVEDCGNELSAAIDAICAPPGNAVGGKRRKSRRNRRRTHRHRR